MPLISSPLAHALLQLRHANPPRAKSLCVSLLGDAIAPHGNAIWLGDLIRLLVPLGLNERLLRTSVFRLVAQHWLRSERHGRRSLYFLSEQGLRHTAHASQRVYGQSNLPWDGTWTLIALPRIGHDQQLARVELRRELLWEGFGLIAPGLFAHPQIQSHAAYAILEKLGIPDRALVLSARDLAGSGGLPIAHLVSQCWNLPDVAQQYQQFLRDFSPLEALLNVAAVPADAFAARMLLLHNWRRIVLHDPQLPDAMLPQDWPGHAARALCGRLYWKLFDASEAHLYAIAGQQQHYSALAAEAFTRFGGRARNPL